MRLWARGIKVPAVCLFALAIFLAGSALADISALRTGLIEPNPNPGQKFPLQGDCANTTQNRISEANPGIDLKTSTWACHGGSSRMMRVFYREGPQECVYIDNDFKNTNGRYSSLFVPLQSAEEWQAFKANIPGGVRLRYGCPGILLTNACGTQVPLPDHHASDVPYMIDLPDGYRAEYICPYTLGDGQVLDHGCGEWQRVRVIQECSLPGGVAPGTVPGATGGTIDPVLPGQIQPIPRN
jgi:hypothetical protein